MWAQDMRWRAIKLCRAQQVNAVGEYTGSSVAGWKEGVKDSFYECDLEVAFAERGPCSIALTSAFHQKKPEETATAELHVPNTIPATTATIAEASLTTEDTYKIAQ
jgi:hypothetical protein